MILCLSLDLPGDQEYVRTTRLLSRTLLEDLKVLSEDTEAIEVIIGALCSNVVRHAANNNSRRSASLASGETRGESEKESKHQGYQVILEYHKEKIVVTVEDKSPDFGMKADVKAIAEPGTSRPEFSADAEAAAETNRGNKGKGVAVEERLGAFGISLVASLSDSLNFEATDKSGTKVCAQKKLRYQSPAAEKRAAKMDESNHGQGAQVQTAPE